MNRKTKIVATMGPATDASGVVERLIRAGVDVFRINFSHGKAEDHAERIRNAREIALRLGRDVGILCDLQGPKIRVEGFAQGPVELHDGQPFALDTALAANAGNDREVGCAYVALPQDVKPGDTLLLNDGAIALRVDAVTGTRVACTVTQGGTLSNRKGINKLGGGLSAPALTDEDLANIRLAAQWNADFLAVSFPRTAEDIHMARGLLKAAGGDAWIVAKIERAEALDNLAAIIEASDVAMVARGDLGVEIGEAELPGVQKRIISLSRELNRAVITATQMMESMINSPIPTRAEVLDVANAVMDGTDAVMLSAETAAGKYPVRTVEHMVNICTAAERQHVPERSIGRLDQHFQRTDEAIAMATVYTARFMHADAIVALTESGMTALQMSRSHGQPPIYALTRNASTRARMTVCRGIEPVEFAPTNLDTGKPVREAIEALVRRGALRDGQRALVTKGDFNGPGGTNTMKIVTVGE
ncbi:MAG: pyruvate kinase [Polycyclovorans sp.]|jgi:pyruvate kinase|nr:pyruvate kinase [Polycyclovorans sp.]MBU0789183.1 pyruvate kinase [Gammaproteobacteria bacterium]MDP1541901.1 pyruvate kinase [Polycyclovorans sp.]|tara:strand:- start:649 stop:2073 length:1425 start_codon:yes stop_codon:yes gene_type:complete